MAILQTCCCWNNVRSGSLACGIYTLILALINGGIIGFNLHFLYSQNQLDGYLQLTKGWFIATLVVCVFLLVTSVGLIIGIHQDSRHFMLPWVAVTILMIVTDTAALIYECISFGLLSFNIIQMVIWLGLSLLNIYCILCVISQYQELKAGRGTLEYLTHQSRVMYSHGIQQVHIMQGPIVMAYPGGGVISSTVQHGGPASITAATITTTVAMAPPDYDVATMSLPQYGSSVITAGAATAAQSPPLLNKNIDKDSPPPPYLP